MNMERRRLLRVVCHSQEGMNRGCAKCTPLMARLPLVGGDESVELN